MARPTIQRAVSEANITADMWNDNFDAIMTYSDDGVQEAKDYVDSFMPSQTGQNGKFLTTDGTTASWSDNVATKNGNNTFSGTNTFSNAVTFSGTVTLPSSSTTTIINGVMPDYANGENKSWNTSYTADKDGWLYASASTTGRGPGSWNLTISSQTVANNSMGIWDEDIRFSTFVPVAKNSTYKATGGSSQNLVFYPCKGV